MTKIKCPNGHEHTVESAKICPYCLAQIPKPVLHSLLVGRDREHVKKDKPAYGIGSLVAECLRQSYYKITEEQVFELEKLWTFSRGSAIHNFVTQTLAKSEKEIFMRREFAQFDVIGFIDAVHDGVIYEFKTTMNIPDEPQSHHALQAQGYYSMLPAEKQKEITKIIVVYLSMQKIKYFEIPKRDITPFLESRAAQLTHSLKSKMPPQREIGWQCKYCEFENICYNRDKNID